MSRTDRRDIRRNETVQRSWLFREPLRCTCPKPSVRVRVQGRLKQLPKCGRATTLRQEAAQSTLCSKFHRGPITAACPFGAGSTVIIF